MNDFTAQLEQELLRAARRRARRRVPIPDAGVMVAAASVLVAAVIAVGAVVLIHGHGAVAGHAGSAGATVTRPLPATGTAPATATAPATRTAPSTAVTVPLRPRRPLLRGARLIGWRRLTAPFAGSHATGVIAAWRAKDGRHVLEISATRLPANSRHNAYGVWLCPSGPFTGHCRFLGFYAKRVNASGRLQAEVALPAGLPDYRKLIITLETSPRLTHVGHVALQGRVP